jgi:hypothetical protein
MFAILTIHLFKAEGKGTKCLCENIPFYCLMCIRIWDMERADSRSCKRIKKKIQIIFLNKKGEKNRGDESIQAYIYYFVFLQNRIRKLSKSQREEGEYEERDRRVIMDEILCPHGCKCKNETS